MARAGFVGKRGMGGIHRKANHCCEELGEQPVRGGGMVIFPHRKAREGGKTYQRTANLKIHVKRLPEFGLSERGKKINRSGQRGNSRKEQRNPLNRGSGTTTQRMRERGRELTFFRSKGRELSGRHF